MDLPEENMTEGLVMDCSPIEPFNLMQSLLKSTGSIPGFSFHHVIDCVKYISKVLMSCTSTTYFCKKMIFSL